MMPLMKNLLILRIFKVIIFWFNVSVDLESPKRMRTGATIGIALGAIFGALVLVLLVYTAMIKRFEWNYHRLSRRHSCKHL